MESSCEKEKKERLFQLPLERDRNETLQEIKTKDQQFTELATNLNHRPSGVASAGVFIANNDALWADSCSVTRVSVGIKEDLRKLPVLAPWAPGGCRRHHPHHP